MPGANVAPVATSDLPGDPDRPLAFEAKVIVVSDRSASGEREDRSGPALRDHLSSLGYRVVELGIVPDGRESVGEAIVAAAEGFAGLVVTTGGTGFAPRDLTPEGTRIVLDREAPGLAEAMRSSSPLGPLSRGVAGTRGRALVLNLPGSPKGAVESLDAVAPLLGHALRLLTDSPVGH